MAAATITQDPTVLEMESATVCLAAERDGTVGFDIDGGAEFMKLDVAEARQLAIALMNTADQASRLAI